MNRRLMALDTGDDIPLSTDLIIVGRHPTCDFRIRSSRVSRIHCCLHVVGDRVFVRDLNSTNGIRINGRSLERGELKSGDVLAIGQLHLKCVDHSEVSAERTATGLSSRDRSDRRENPKASPPPEAVGGSSVEIRIRTGS